MVKPNKPRRFFHFVLLLLGFLYSRSVPAEIICVVCGVPAPTNLTANFVSSSQVHLHWDPDSSVAQFRIDRSTNGVDSWMEVARVVGSYEYEDTTPVWGATNYYRVQVNNYFPECPCISLWSEIAWATIPVTNAVTEIGGHFLVRRGQPVSFVQRAPDPPDDFSCRWDFGDGSTSAGFTADHTYEDCGLYPLQINVTGSGQTNNSDFSVAVACPMQLTKLQATLRFSRRNADACSLKATLDLPADYHPAGQSAIVEVCGAQVSLILNSHGRALDANGRRAASLRYNQVWKFSARLKHGAWREIWSRCGLVNADISSPGVPVTIPVSLLLGDKAFAGEFWTLYRAKADVVGSTPTD